MITITLNPQDHRHLPAIQALCDRKVQTNPHLNGAVIRITRADYTSVDGADEITGAALLSDIRNCIESAERLTRRHPEFRISTLQQLIEHQVHAGNGLVSNDGSSGGQYYAVEEISELLEGNATDPLMIVSEKDDDEAWHLAREAFSELEFNDEPKAVFVGIRADDGTRTIWVI